MVQRSDLSSRSLMADADRPAADWIAVATQIENIFVDVARFRNIEVFHSLRQISATCPDRSTRPTRATSLAAR